MVFEKNPEKPLDTSEHRAVEHDRPCLGTGAIDVFHVEAFGEYEVELDGSARPRATELIAENELELRTIERAIPRLLDELESRVFAGRAKDGLGAIPSIVVPGPLEGSSRQ